MGFNTLITLRNSDLPKIAEDPNFGKVIRDMVAYGDRLTGWNKGPRGSSIASVRDLRATVSPDAQDYDLWAGQSHHASGEMIHVLSDGRLHGFYRSKETFESYDALARAIAPLGCRTELKSAGQVWTAQEPGLASDAEWMHGYDPSALAAGFSSFIVLNDALHDIKSEANIGRKIKQAVEWWCMAEKTLSDAIASGQNMSSFGQISRSISAGNHANPISMVAVTPVDRTDILMTGGNWGRVVRPHKQNCEHLSEAGGDARRIKLYADQRPLAISEAKSVLLRAGFHVRMPGRTRAEGPAHWSKKHWITEADLPARELTAPEP